MNEFLKENALYVVLVVTLMVWFGIAFYLNRIERRVQILEKSYRKSTDRKLNGE